MKGKKVGWKDFFVFFEIVIYIVNDIRKWNKMIYREIL